MSILRFDVNNVLSIDFEGTLNFFSKILSIVFSTYICPTMNRSRSLVVSRIFFRSEFDSGFRMGTIGNVQFLDVFCIFGYRKNKQFFRFLGTGSKLLLFRDGAVRLLRKDSNLFFAILRKPSGSGINIVLDKSDRHASFGYFFIFEPVSILTVLKSEKQE